jgi:hypothetical protein
VSGLLQPDGRRLEIECKRPKGGRHEDDQKKFQAMIESMGGIYILAKSVMDVALRLRKEGYRLELEEAGLL